VTKPRVTDVKDDPARPWKTLGAAIVGCASYVIATNMTDNQFVIGACTLILTVGAVFGIRNPKVRK